MTLQDHNSPARFPNVWLAEAADEIYTVNRGDLYGLALTILRPAPLAGG